MINLYVLQCTYCGTCSNHKVSNIENYIRWQECEHCSNKQFKARKLEAVDYYKGDPEFPTKIDNMKVELESSSWY